MAGNKYIANNVGKLKEVAATQVSAGVADANKILALGTDGLLDVSVLPVGVGAEVTILPSFENLVAGDFVNIFNDGGTVKVRKADATTNGKPAKGFVIANVAAPANATVYRVSQTNTQLSGLTLGVEYYLSTTPGIISSTAPSASGNIVQAVGVAATTTSLVFENTQFFELV